MTEGAQQRVGFSAIGGREAKADKILAILHAAGKPLSPDQRLLDIGTGSGQIAAALGRHTQAIGVDVVDQRTAGRDLPFALADLALPFPDASFDVVISNHVIEHTSDPARHLCEIRRVLKADGLAYVATPNRLWPWEFHSRLPLLHYLPRHLFSSVGRATGRLHEPVHLLTQRGVMKMAAGYFRIQPWHHRILANPPRYALRLPTWAAWLVRVLPTSLLSATAPLQPTLILLLYPE